MPDSNHVIYPAPKMPEVFPIEQLQKLDGYIKQASKNIARFTRLSKLGILESERIFYTDSELKKLIEHWQMTYGNMVRCWNECLENMKIK